LFSADTSDFTCRALNHTAALAHDEAMKNTICLSIVCVFLPFAVQEANAATLDAGTVRLWDKYVALTEARIARDIENPSRFLSINSTAVRTLLKSGEVYVQRGHVTVADGDEFGVANGMIHHWAGSVFIPGVSMQQLLNWLQDYDHHDGYFKEVEQSKLLSRDGDTFEIFLRLTKTQIVTVRYDTNHLVTYRRYSQTRASSRSVATQIHEIQNSGNDHGFLWRLNSYWRFSEEDGGVYVECESISLSRSIPFGLGWLINRYVDSVPRESLRNTLLSIRGGVSQTAHATVR
jgi:hypothetical protein